jgi:hypothetical protein
MRRTVAVVWHASFSVIAAGLYYFFVLPRWWELTGYIPHTPGTALRILAAVIIGLAALPVVFTLLRIRKPEYDTPRPARALLVASIAAHVLAGVLIAGTAISEIWLPLDRFGPWLFGVYGGAAAVALLGIGAFYLSFFAALPPKPPKPPKAEKKRRRFGKKAESPEETPDEESSDVAAETPEEAEETVEAAESPKPKEPKQRRLFGRKAKSSAKPLDEETEAVTQEATDEAAEKPATAEATAPQPTKGDTTDKTEAATETAAKPGEADKEDKEDQELLPAGRPRHKMPTGKRRPKSSG